MDVLDRVAEHRHIANDYIIRRSIPNVDVNDFCSQVVYKAQKYLHNHPAKIPGNVAALEAWLPKFMGKVARYHWIRCVETLKRDRLVKTEVVPEVFVARGSTPTQAARRNELRRKHEAALPTLSAKDQNLLKWRDSRESYAIIARRLCISAVDARQQVHRARKRLKEAMGL